MRLESIVREVALVALVSAALCSCKRSSSIKESPITGKPSDPPVAMPAKWDPEKRYIYRVDASTSTQVPRRKVGNLIRADVTVGQDLAFTVTNSTPDGRRIIEMELLAVQLEAANEDRVTSTFDSENKALIAEENPIAERLQRLVGLRLGLHFSPDNRVTRVDGTKDLSSRMSSNGRSSIRGVAAGVINRFFSAQFFREILEMGMLPKDSVKVGDQWTVNRPVNSGLWAASAFLEMTYTFKGWQQHDGTNCARLEFAGVFRTNQRTNQSLIQRVAIAANSTSTGVEEGSVTGVSWYEPGVALPVETVYDQNITTKSTSVRRASRPRVNTNDAAVTVGEATTTNLPPVTNSPPQSVTTTTVIQQHTTLKLIEIQPGGKN
jgi:hypothetical protein